MREIIKTFSAVWFWNVIFQQLDFWKFHSENFIGKISRETFGKITIIYLWKIKMLDDDILFFGSLNCLNISQQGEISRDGTHNTILNTVWIHFLSNTHRYWNRYVWISVNNSTAEHRLVLQFLDHEKLFETVKEGGQSKARLNLLKKFVQKYNLVSNYHRNEDQPDG